MSVVGLFPEGEEVFVGGERPDAAGWARVSPPPNHCHHRDSSRHFQDNEVGLHLPARSESIFRYSDPLLAEAAEHDDIVSVIPRAGDSQFLAVP